MADKYDKNGYNSSDFKRNSGQEASAEQQDGEDGAKINEKAGDYVRELLSEKIKLNAGKFPVSARLIDQEVAKVQTTGRIPAKDLKYVDVYREKPVRVVVKVLVPIKEHPKINFIGKLMGPKGNTMKQLQDETMCKMAVFGRGSMRDRQREEELRNSLDPKHAHLSDELHVEISAFAPPAEAHARIAYALAEVKKYLIPDPADMLRPPPHMHRDIMERDLGTARQPLLQTPPQGHAAHSGREYHPPDTGAERWALLETPKSKEVVYRACVVTKRSYSYQNPELSTDAPPPHAPPRIPRPPPSRMPHQAMRPMPSKTKVLSILDRARSAMETSYPYEDHYAASEPPVRQGPRGPPRAPEPDYYSYERGGGGGAERFYEDDSYYKEEREYKANARDVGTRRPGPVPAHSRHYRASPYQRAPK